jgi:hypothetical protein
MTVWQAVARAKERWPNPISPENFFPSIGFEQGDVYSALDRMLYEQSIPRTDDTAGAATFGLMYGLQAGMVVQEAITGEATSIPRHLSVYLVAVSARARWPIPMSSEDVIKSVGFDLEDVFRVLNQMLTELGIPSTDDTRDAAVISFRYGLRAGMVLQEAAPTA